MGHLKEVLRVVVRFRVIERGVNWHGDGVHPYLCDLFDVHSGFDH